MLQEHLNNKIYVYFPTAILMSSTQDPTIYSDSENNTLSLHDTVTVGHHAGDTTNTVTKNSMNATLSDTTTFSAGDPLSSSSSCANDDLDPYGLIGSDITFVMLINTQDNGQVIPEAGNKNTYQQNCTIPLDDDTMTEYVQIYEPGKTIHDCDLTVRPNRYQCYLPYADLTGYVNSSFRSGHIVE